MNLDGYLQGANDTKLTQFKSQYLKLAFLQEAL